MATQNLSQSGDLFFEPLVKGYLSNPRFVRRDWLAMEIDHRLHTDGSRFVLLTAEPGFGKSAFMAQLAADHPDWPRYFIRRDQRSPLSDVGTRSFLLRIGFQLAARYPELFTIDTIRLTVEQRVGAVKDGGSVVGAEIGKILGSPFHNKIVQIQQQIEEVAGRVVGLRIDELVVEPRLLDLADLQYMALIDPARAMQSLHPDRQIVILVDALDEVRYHQTVDNILAWLGNCPDLPSNVRFVLTSRPPEDAVSLFMEKQQRVLQVLAIAAHDRNETTQLSRQVDNDLEAYVNKLASDAAIKTHLDGLPGGATGFKQQAVVKADGNIGYLDALARAIDQALVRPDSQVLAALLTVKTLPDDLQDLYAFFLHQIKQSLARQRIEMVDQETGGTYDKPVWPAVHSRVLAVLAVAREPVTLEQIRYLGGIAANWIDLNAAKDSLLQFLDIVDGRYRLYHATLPEFLTDAHTREQTDTQDLYVGAGEWHKQIGDRYWRSHSQDWSQCDAYGLAHLPAHLDAADDRKRLRTLLLDYGWLQAKLDRLGISALLADFAFGQQAADDARQRLSHSLEIADYDLVRDDAGPRQARDAIRLAAHIVEHDKTQLPGQLVGRLSGVASDDLARLVQAAKDWHAWTWLCPLTPSLTSPGGPLILTLQGRAGGHAGTPRSVAISANGRMAISAGNSSNDQAVRVWDLDAGRCLYVFPEQARPGGGTPLAIAEDGHLAVTAYNDEVRVWDLTTGTQRAILPGNGVAVRALTLLEDGTRVIAAADDGSRRQWHIARAVEIDLTTPVGVDIADPEVGSDAQEGQHSAWPPDDTPGQLMALSKDGRWALQVADNRRDLVVWDVAHQVPKLELPHPRTISAVAMTPDGRRAITADYDHDLRLWDLTHEPLTPTQEDAFTELRFRGFTAHGATGLFETLAGELLLRDLGPNGLVPTPGPHDVIIQQTQSAWRSKEEADVRTAAKLGLKTDTDLFRTPIMAVSESRQRAVSAWRGGGKGRDAEEPETPVELQRELDITLWDLRSTPTETPLRGHSLSTLALAMTPDGRWAISGGAGRLVRLWDLERAAQRWVLRGHQGIVFAVGITPDGRRGVSASEDATVRLWDLDTGKLIATYTGGSTLDRCWISPDGTAMVAQERTGDKDSRFHYLQVRGLAEAIK